jgi:phenylacetate-CoA ligase
MAPELKQHIKPFANLAERVHSGPRISFRSLLPRFNFAAQFHTNIGADPEWDISAARAIASRNARLLVGRPKVLLRLADILSELGQLANLTPWVILAAGDNLYLNDRLSIERAFRKRIYNAYASVEGGFIAMECAEHRAMHVFPEQCVVEVQDGDSLTSSGYGEIVITNLKNWAMPFIRYRTGDIGHIDIIECKCGRTGQVITRIDGRKSMLFDVDGTTLNPSFLNDALSYLPLKDIQIIKTDNNSFVVRVVPNSAANVADLCERIAHMVTEACSAREIQMQVVTSIGSLCEKTQRYVSGAT